MRLKVQELERKAMRQSSTKKHRQPVVLNGLLLHCAVSFHLLPVVLNGLLLPPVVLNRLLLHPT